MAVVRKSCLPRCLLTLMLLQLPKLDSAHFDVMGPPEPILAMVGADAELPCHLSPGTTRFLPGAGSAGLGGRHLGCNGRSILCVYFSSLSKIKPASPSSALGSEPHITMEVQESGEVRLECTSVGWYPEPQVQWRSTKGEEFLATSESRSPDEEGLFTVAASVTLRDSSMDSVSCCIRNLLLGQEKEVGISIPAPVSPRLTPWMVSVAVILVVLGLLTIGSMFFIWRLYKERSRERRSKFSSTGNHSFFADWKKAALHAVDVTLDPDTAHPHLFLYEDAKSVRLEDSRQKLPENPERFDSWPCVLGREAFTEGRHYWEVEVGDRTDWAIGVCRENVMKKGFDPMTPDNGFWAVELYGNGYWALTPLRTPLPLAAPPRRVGVFLDYESGDISFYNMTDGSHIYAFPGISFSGPLRPFFCLWSCGKKPLTICPVSEGPEGVTVIPEAQNLSKDIPLSRVGQDSTSGDTDTLRSKLISSQRSRGAP
uniref:Butyrophilin subfamily 1 member A1 n=1 Tax=Spermophilus dauricus TaxID=99837 RepID=A0A8C9PRL4_SPEDA